MPILYNVGNKLTAGSEPPQLYRYQDRVLGDGGTLETRDEASTFIRRLRSAGVLGSTVIAGVAGGYKAGTLYSIIGPDLDVTRGTVKNRVNRAGVLSEVASGVPATTYVGGVLRGTTVEPSAVNLLQRSEEFDNAYWGKAGTTTPTVSANAITAPDGNMTADLLTGTGGASMRLQRSLTVTTGAHTFSFYVKNNTETIARFNVFDGSVDRGATFNFSSESFTAISANVTVGFEKLNDGWYRILGTYPSFGTTTANVQLFVSGTLSLYYWGAQLELGSVATSYIKTEGSAQTRNADVITKTGLGSVLPQTEGWVYAEVDVRLLSIARRGLSFTNDLTATILNGFIYSVASTNLHQVILRANNAEVFRIETAASAGIAKVLFRFASGNSKLFINAVESGVRTQSFSFTGLVDVMALGSTQNGTNQLIDPIHSYAIGSGAITDAQAIQLTTL
jgi:hypothetical protein